MSTQRQLPGTDTQADIADDELDPDPDEVALPTGSTCFVPELIHHPECPHVDADAQMIPRAAGAQKVLEGRLKWADCMEGLDD